MALSEFALIERYFTQKQFHNSQNRLGVGDDCALLAVPKGFELAVTTDTMVEGVHFFADVLPHDLAHKLLAVNLSDLASMGAEPFAVLLSLTLPRVDEYWLAQFSNGFFKLANCFRVDLIGGDTSRGPLTLGLQAMGLVPEGKALKRSNAQPGDLIYVSNTLGDAGLGLKIKKGEYDCQQDQEQVLKQFNQPIPRVDEGIRIREYASAGIDISDGLLADLSHILTASDVGACLKWDQIPCSNAIKKYIELTDDWQMPLNAGDDYELCFTVSPEKINQIDIDCFEIGVIERVPGIRMERRAQIINIESHGFKHFS